MEHSKEVVADVLKMYMDATANKANEKLSGILRAVMPAELVTQLETKANEQNSLYRDAVRGKLSAYKDGEKDFDQLTSELTDLAFANSLRVQDLYRDFMTENLKEMVKHIQGHENEMLEELKTLGISV